MRIISGKSKGMRLFPPRDSKVRPTTDRVKETIFNILSSKITLSGAAVLDLFCGSGALGIESLSRGAKRAVFADKNSDSAKLTRLNLKNSGLEEGGAVFNTDFELALKKLSGDKFDAIFLDPPYFDNIIDRSIFLIKKYDILADNGIIVAEHPAANSLSIDDKEFIIDRREFGSMATTFLTFCEVPKVGG